MIMRGGDPYALLGVPHDASTSEITRAYRHLVRAHHPDTAPSPQLADSAVLARLAAAYALLRDPSRRADYDRRHPSPRTVRESSPSAATGRSGPPDLRIGPVRRHPSGGAPRRPELWAGPVRRHPLH